MNKSKLYYQINSRLFPKNFWVLTFWVRVIIRTRPLKLDALFFIRVSITSITIMKHFYEINKLLAENKTFQRRSVRNNKPRLKL